MTEPIDWLQWAPAHVARLEARLAAVEAACNRYAQHDEDGDETLLPEDGYRFLRDIRQALQ